MNITPWVASAGAITGIASLSWNIYLKLSTGPKLRVQAWAGMVKVPAPSGSPKCLKVSIQNIGTTPTTLTNYGLFQYASPRRRSKKLPEFSAVLNNYDGALTPFKLGVGDEAQILMEHDLAFDNILSKGTVYFAVWHAFSKKPVQVPIINPSVKSISVQAGK